jgi:hypothetical protein
MTVAIALLAMEVILLAALVPADWSDHVRAQEDQWLQARLGVATAERVLTTAGAWYGTLFINTGLVPGSYALLLPDAASVRTTPELGRLAASPLWPWVEDRLDGIWQALHGAMQRLVLVLAWWPFLAFALAGAIAEGLLRRRIRQTGFDYPSPFAHRLAVRGLRGIAVAVAAGLLVPLPLSPLAVPVLGTLLGLAVAVMVTQTQKRL